MLTLKYLPNIFESLPKWRKFAKSGHTEKAIRQKKLKKSHFKMNASIHLLRQDESVTEIYFRANDLATTWNRSYKNKFKQRDGIYRARTLCIDI